MKRYGHDPVGEVKCLLYAVSVVYINVEVQNPGVPFKKFYDGDGDVIDVAETGRFGPMRVMQTPRPVHRHVG